MADKLDAELLALAGGDESSGEESPPSPNDKSPSASQSPPPQSSNTISAISQATDMGRKGIARRVKKTRTNRRRTKRHESEDGELSSSSNSSLQSAPMDQSDSEGRDSPDAGTEAPLFPYEKIYESAEEKARIMAMPEITREQTLAERREAVDRHKQDMALRRLLASRERQEAKLATKNKRKADSDLGDSQRKSSRQRTTRGGQKAGEVGSAMEAYKRHREEKKLGDEARRRDAANRPQDRSPQGDDFSDMDADGESEPEWDGRFSRRSPTPPKDEPIAELADIQHVRVGRLNFAEVCFYPGFEETLSGCYTRICIGPGKNGANEYRLCKIVGFATDRPYALETPNGRRFATNQYVIAAHGKAQRRWAFLECSNSRFTEDEWRRYRATLANEDIKLPTRTELSRKLDAINALIKHRFTSKELDDKIKRQDEILDSINRGPERRRLQDQKHEASMRGDYDEAEKFDDALRSLVPERLAFNTSLLRVEGKEKPKADKMLDVNRRNDRFNSETIRKAQLQEMKKLKPRKAESKGDTGLLKPPAGIDDLFESDRSRAGTPLSATGTPNGGTPRAGTPLRSSRPAPRDKKGLPMIRKRLDDEEALAEFDLGIEIDV
ncbi:MAG: hypothetical protein Q9160_007919 [Pyrenula sp. 1 TL-2023]